MTKPLKFAAQYLRESKEELEKVTWPTRQQTLRYSLLVVAASIGMGLFFAGLDASLSLGFEKLVGLIAN